jgi:hypothetical protein
MAIAFNRNWATAIYGLGSAKLYAGLIEQERTRFGRVATGEAALWIRDGDPDS